MSTRRTVSQAAAALVGACLMTLAEPPQALAQSTSLFAQSGRLGLGFGGSSLVSGVTAKYYTASRTAVQAHLGTWVGWGYMVGLDGIYEMPQLMQGEAGALNWHLGVGVAVGTYGPAEAWSGGLAGGASGIVGIGFQFRPFPVELVADLRPTVIFGYARPFYPGGGGAIRFFF